MTLPRCTGAVLLLVGIVATAAGAQGVIRGVVYDSLIGTPLGGAEVWVRGLERRTITSTGGRFLLDSVPPGRYLIALADADLDSAGFYNLAAPVTVRSGDTTVVSLAVPSLATVWHQRCLLTNGTEPDSGIVFGIVDDAASGDHLVGAGVLALWFRLAKRGRTEVVAEDRLARTRTDSVGAYFVCGVAKETTIRVRAYARTDSTGAIDVRLGARPITRRDLTIAFSEGTDSSGRHTPAALRGVARTPEGRPLGGARVVVREAAATVSKTDGTFLLTDLPGGTQWLSVQAVGREPVEQVVVLRAGDTASVTPTLGPVPVTLEAIQVVAARRSRVMMEFEERRRLGTGYALTQEQLARAGSVRSALTVVPSVTISGRSVFDYTVFLPSPSIGGRALCVATLYVDGQRAEYDELQAFRPGDLMGIEIYVRASSAPAKFQPVESGCGVVLVWTKYLR